MPFCPVCRAEYVPGIKVCPEHAVPLVEELPPEFVSEDDWEIAYTSALDYDAEMVRARLEDAGILARVLSKVDHAFGMTVGELAVVHVLVHADDLDDAKRIISEDDSIDPDSLDMLAGETGEDE